MNIIFLLQMFHFIGEKMQTRRGSPKSMWLPCPSVIKMPAPQKDSGERGVTVDMGTGLSLAGLLYLGIGLLGWRIEHANLFLVGTATTVKVHGLLGGCGQVTLTVTIR